jgi:hypothetical protein
VNAARSRSARGQGLFAVAAALVVVATLLGLDRVGPRSPAEPAVGAASSGAWICPHGGDAGWTVTLFLANPGSVPVTARLTRLGREASGPPDLLEVPPESSVRVDLPADERGSATYVEHFGGWIGTGWVLASPDGKGIAAEPCAPEASRRWHLPDGTTQLGERSFVIVANPFDLAAVLDVAIYTPDRAPIRDSEWTDLVVPPRRGIALLLNSKVEGEPAAAVQLVVSVGRVAASSLGISDRTKARSVLGSTEATTESIVPIMSGSGQTELLLLSTADRTIRFGATVLSEKEPRPAGELTEQEHLPTAAAAYPIPLEGGPAAIDVFTLDGASAVAALRALGPSEDPGASGGAADPAPAWVVFPAAVRTPSVPGAVLVNPGDEDAVVTVEILAREGGTAPAPITVEVSAHAVVAVPPEFLLAAPGSALLVRAEGASIVALNATTSGGTDGDDTYALSVGVPLPQEP